MLFRSFASFVGTIDGSDFSTPFIVGFGFRLPDAALSTALLGGCGDLPAPARKTSVHARVSDAAGRHDPYQNGSRPCCLLRQVTLGLPGEQNFDAQSPGLHVPLSTLRVRPRGRPRMTRGRCGWLDLHRNGLSPSTPCRSPGAPKVVLALQLQFSPEMSFARIGLMGSAPRRPCEDIGVRDAPLGKLRGDTADFLDRPADQERRFGRDRSFVFLSDRPVLAR